MKKLIDQQTIFFDVDETLVLHSYDQTEDNLKDTLSISYDHSGYPYNNIVLPNTPVIESLIRFKKNGSNIVVWSQSGSDWAEAVIKSLKLTEYVDIIVNKPMWYYDDLPSSAFMPPSSRLYSRRENVTT